MRAVHIKYRPRMHKNGAAAPVSAAHDPLHLEHIQLCGRVECVHQQKAGH